MVPPRTLSHRMPAGFFLLLLLFLSLFCLFSPSNSTLEPKDTKFSGQMYTFSQSLPYLFIWFLNFFKNIFSRGILRAFQQQPHQVW